MQPLLMHLQFLTEQALPRKDENAATLANSLGYFFQLTGQYEAARPYTNKLWRTMEKCWGRSTRTQRGPEQPGALLHAMGQYEAPGRISKKRWRSTGKCRGRAPGHGHELNNLGGCFEPWDSMNRPLYYEQALANNGKVLGEEHPVTARSLNNLGSLLWPWDSMRPPGRITNRR